jgi:hypothetical protein
MILQFPSHDTKLLSQLTNLGITDIRSDTYPNFIAVHGMLNDKMVSATGVTKRLALEKLLNKILSGTYISTRIIKDTD